MKHLLFYIILYLPHLGCTQIDSGFVKISSGKLFYRIWGEGQPILFINGGYGLASDTYSLYAEAFSHVGKVILFDQRGTGKSSLRQNPSPNRIRNTGELKGNIRPQSRSNSKHDIWNMVADIEKLRKHLKIEKWSIFGHSFGGTYAIYYLSKHSEQVDKAILSASPVYGSIRGFPRKAFPPFSEDSLTDEQRKIYTEIVRRARKNPENGIDEADRQKLYILNEVYLAKFYVANPENYDKAIDWFLKIKKTKSYKVVGRSNDRKKMERKIPRINTPVLIIHGDSDWITLENPQENHRLFKNSTLEILKNCGHIMILDQPEAYVKVIGSFLQKGPNRISTQNE